MRRGSLLIEVSASIAVLSIAAVLLVQFMQAVATQKSLLAQHTLARQAAANLLEEELAQPYVNIASHATLPLWPEAEEALFEPLAKSTVTVSDELVPTKQIVVNVSWGRAEQRESVQLVGWRFNRKEAPP